MLIRAHAATDPGRVRENNEDAFLVREAARIFAVADGLGGHQAGEVASRMLVETLDEFRAKLDGALSRYRETRQDAARREIIGLLSRVIEDANQRIFEAARGNENQRGMATTALIFVPADQDGFVCHVGDSRLYLYRNHRLFQVTEDHTVVMQLFKRGRVTAEDMKTHPQRNILEQCVGFESSVAPDLLFVDLLPDDLFLLCTDGVSDTIPDAELQDLAASRRGQNLVEAVVERARSHGGWDNITVVAVEVFEEDEPTHVVRNPMALPMKVRFLQDIALFSKLSDQECLKVNRVLYEQPFETGEVVFRVGERGTMLYIVAQGRVELRAGDVLLGTLGPGDHFGDLSILTEIPQTATVTALAPTTLYLIRKEDLLGLFDEDPVIGNKVMLAFLRDLGILVRDLVRRVKA